MKKIPTLVIFCLFALSLVAQGPYTITADNFPIYTPQTFDGPNTPNGTHLIPAPNGNWDLSSYHSGTTVANNYVPETDPFYTIAGIDVYLDAFKSLNANLGYQIYHEFDFNATGVYDKGVYISPQAYGLGALTGNPLDSLTIPFQGAIFQQGRQLMQFPATFSSKWHSESRRIVDFNLTVTAVGLNKTPCKHVYTIFRTDSVVGWGKLRVYTNGVASTGYNVLIDQLTQYAVDSFLVAGSPAPPALLNAFGMSQGQKTDVQYRHNVYREGYSTPLAIVFHDNNTFATPTELYFDTQNLSTSATTDAEPNEYATLLYPNPSPSGELHIQMMGRTPAVSAYEIVDMQGRKVQNGASLTDGTALRLQMGSELPNGTYVLRLLGERGQTVVSEPFVLAR